MRKVCFVPLEDIEGDIDRIKKIEPGKTTFLPSVFEDVYGEHESLIFKTTGVGLRKIGKEENGYRYLCIKTV